MRSIKGFKIKDGVLVEYTGKEAVVVVPDDVVSVSGSAFSSCTKLIRIDVDEKNKTYKSIDGNLYTKDGKILIKYATGKESANFSVPDIVTNIGRYAFECCDCLERVIIPDSVTIIGDGAFVGCISLTSVRFVENSKLTLIGRGAFEGCESLKSITIPDSVIEIDEGAFFCCENLVITASVGSYAEEYAKENGIELNLI